MRRKAITEVTRALGKTSTKNKSADILKHPATLAVISGVTGAMATTAITKLINRSEGLLKENSRLHEDLNTQEQQSRSLTDNLIKALASNQDLLKQNIELKTECSGAKKELSEIKQELSEIKQELSETKKDVQTHQAKCPIPIFRRNAVPIKQNSATKDDSSTKVNIPKMGGPLC